MDAQSQLVIALGSEGIACTKNDKGDVASYNGYSVEGDNVVVTVESAKSGRPVTRGAIIPRPAPGGQVLIKPASKKVPFGRGLSGDGKACSVGSGA